MTDNDKRSPEPVARVTREQVERVLEAAFPAYTKMTNVSIAADELMRLFAGTPRADGAK